MLFYSHLIIFREQTAKWAKSFSGFNNAQTLDKPRHPKKSMNKDDLYFAACDRCVFLKTLIQMIQVCIQKINQAQPGRKRLFV